MTLDKKWTSVPMAFLCLLLSYADGNALAEYWKQCTEVKLPNDDRSIQSILLGDEIECAIPLQTFLNLIVVEGTIDKQQGILVIDTGLKGLVLSERFFSSSSRKAKYLIGSDGNECRGSSRKCALSLGCLERTFDDALVLSLDHIVPHPDSKLLGIVGWDVFSEGSLTVDMSSKSLCYQQKEFRPFPKTNFNELFLSLEHGVPMVRAKIYGRSASFVLDTGASTSVIDRTFRKRLHGIQEKPFRKWNAGSKQAISGSIDQLELAGNTLFMQDVLCYSLMQLRLHFKGANLAGIFGQPLFEQFLITLDFAHWRIFLQEYPKKQYAYN